MTSQPNEPALELPSKVSIAVSGGGHRAAAWGVGVLLYLVDAGLHSRVDAVSSVSGGSLLNAVLAIDDPHFTTTSNEEARQRLFTFARHIAGSPSRFWTAIVGFIVLNLIGVGLLVTSGSEALGVAVLVGIAAVLWSSVAGRTAGGFAWKWPGFWIYAELLVLGLVGVAVAWRDSWYWGVLALIGWLVVFGVRNLVVSWALARTLTRRASGMRRNGPAVKLADISSDATHIFCATEVAGGHHAYFSNRFAINYDIGIGAPTSTGLHSAVQASANLPFAFPIRWMRTRSFSFGLERREKGKEREMKSWLALSDGGVYDNMADQWFDRQASRHRRMVKRLDEAEDLNADERPRLAALVEELPREDPDLLLIANASGGLSMRNLWKTWLPGLGEAAGVKAVQDILYDNGTSQRRKYLLMRFRHGLQGTMVQIDKTPYGLPEAFGDGNDEIASRARHVIRLLEGTGLDRDDWSEIVRHDRDVATTLKPLGVEDTAELVAHAYLLAMANCYTLFGIEPPRKLRSKDGISAAIQAI